MGANTKQLRNRIKSVDSTLHTTKAMGLVAASKMRRAMEGMNRGREYEAAVRAAVDSMTRCPECAKSPYMRPSSGGKLGLVVIAGDRGMAGGYNANIFRFIRDLSTDNVEIIPIGKRACDRFKGPLRYAEDFSCEEARELALTLCRRFAEGVYDRVEILCTEYRSMLSQEVTLHRVFPLTRAENAPASAMVFEPDEITVLNAAMPEYVTGMLVSAVRESFASEVAARRCAMDSAGKNARQMIDTLQLDYNRARQSAITQEITEIVAGSDAEGV